MRLILFFLFVSALSFGQTQSGAFKPTVGTEFLNTNEFHVGIDLGFSAFRVDTTSYVNGPIFGVAGITYSANEQWFLEGGAAYTSFFFDGKTRMARMYGLIGIKDETVSRLFAGIGLYYFTNFRNTTTFGPMFKVSVVPYRVGRLSFKVYGEIGSTISKLSNVNVPTSVTGSGGLQVLYRL